MDRATLTAIANDPATFRQHVVIDTDGGPRKLADVCDAWQAADFAALDAGWRRCIGLTADGGPSRAYLERPRGHSKTGDLAIMGSWPLVASPRQIYAVAAAGDKDQARLQRDAIAKLASANRFIGDVLDVQAYAVRNKHTGSVLEILASDAATSYGLTPDFVICDELTHWRSEDLWTSLFSAAAKKSNCLLVVISNAGTGQGTSWQWRVRSSAASSPDWYFRSLDGPVASWISAERLDEQRRMLPGIAYDRLWLNRWTTGAGDALTDDDVTAAITRRGPLRRPRPYHCYVAGLDIGLAKDASAFVILAKHVGALREVEDEREPEPVPRNLPVAMQAAYDLGWWKESAEERERRTYHDEVIRPTGRLRLVACHVWRPGRGRRVDLSSIERTILREHERFGLATVNYDPFQSEMLAERAGRAGVPMERVPFSGGNLQAMASATLDAFTGRTIDLYPCEQLLADLRQLRIEEKSYGVRLTSPRGPTGHGDCATALALACLAAQGVTQTYEDRYIDGDLVFSVGR